MINGHNIMGRGRRVSCTRDRKEGGRRRGVQEEERKGVSEGRMYAISTQIKKAQKSNGGV